MTGIVNLYFCQIEPEIRAFRLKKFNIQVQSTPPPPILMTTKIFGKGAKNRVKNEVF